MTGYTVHTGTSKKFASGWDSIFESKEKKKKAGGSKSKKQAGSKTKAKKRSANKSKTGSRKTKA